MLRKIGSVLVAIISALFVWNTSSFTAPITVDGPQLMAHRGVHQQYDRTDLGMSDCTAARWIDTPDQFARVPNGFGGLVWTNRIEVIAKDAD